MTFQNKLYVFPVVSCDAITVMHVRAMLARKLLNANGSRCLMVANWLLCCFTFKVKLFVRFPVRPLDHISMTLSQLLSFTPWPEENGRHVNLIYEMLTTCSQKTNMDIDISSSTAPQTVFSFSSQKTFTRSRDCCHYTWCSAGTGLPSLPQYDPQVSDFFFCVCFFHASVNTVFL